MVVREKHYNFLPVREGAARYLFTLGLQVTTNLDDQIIEQHCNWQWLERSVWWLERSVWTVRVYTSVLNVIRFHIRLFWSSFLNVSNWAISNSICWMSNIAEEVEFLLFKLIVTCYYYKFFIYFVYSDALFIDWKNWW